MLATAKRWSERHNAEALAAYIRRASDWANGSGLTRPEIPTAVEYVVTFEPFSITERATKTPLTSATPESFKPTYRTDEGAVGGRIGAPIPDAFGKPTGRFHIVANARANNGDTESVNGITYVYVIPERSFGGVGFWVRL